MVVPRFVRQALSGETITVYGDGSQRRSFTWVEDSVNAMISLMCNPKAYGEVFNIGHYKETSIHELAGLIKKLTGSNSGIAFIPYEEAYEAGFEDMARRLPNIDKIQQLTGYQPTLDLGEMVQRIIRHERSLA
jgi:UDP-glucose 4-epimerase